jgi:antitoxin VapB
LSLNIKNSEADRLVNEVSRITGESKTQAVIESLRQRLARVQQINDRSRMKEDLLAIGEKCAAYPGDREDHGDLLYNQQGFPR